MGGKGSGIALAYVEEKGKGENKERPEAEERTKGSFTAQPALHRYPSLRQETHVIIPLTSQ
jgi:hypothetical protein